jgi:hypothetical protein
MNEIHGGCACGQVLYEVCSTPLQVVACHCRLCRSMNGAPFSAYAVVRQKDFRLTAGEVSSYQATERTTKHFCRACGTPIFNSNPTIYKGLTMVYVGTTEDPQRHVPVMNIFCESKLEWVEPNAGSKVFSKSPGEA